MALTDPAHRYITVTGSDGSVVHSDVVKTTFTWFCNQIVGHMSTGWWATFVVIGLAIYSIWMERNQEVGWFSFSVPVTKRQIVRAKVLFDIGSIIAIFTVLALSLAVIDEIVQIHYPLLDILRWWFAELSVQCAMYSLAFLVATLIANAAAVAVLTLGLAYLPMYVGIPLIYALGANWVVFTQPSQYHIPISWWAMWAITHLSPLNWFNVDFQFNKMHAWPFFVGFLVFSVIAHVFAEWIYHKMPNERFTHLFAFRWLQHPMTAVLSIVVATILVRFISFARNNYLHEMVWIAGITIVLWVMVTLIRRQMGQKA